ncbi:hypothetical protein [Lewinella sp. W8]|uniref:hypothetical protein n=1 Tax=Lewinella sp. W8 TaxID=2528208 RepID=UPI001068B21D|nr:hypothetical protein [Lewinella sp. W8]MTB51152.1 hypothetical protein [Lewinella sp. W8]
MNRNSMQKMLTRALSLAFFILAGQLPGQTIIDELIRMDSSQTIAMRAEISAQLLWRFNPGGTPGSTRELLHAYADNPYITGFLGEKKLRDAILTIPIDSIMKMAAGADERTGRDRFRRTYDRSALFNQRQAFDIRWLADEYAQPDPVTLNQLPEKAQQAQASLGSTDYASVLLSGLSDWIQKRAQEEFTVTFMGRLQEKIDQGNLWYLFPATAHWLRNVDVAEYRSFLPEVRTAFAKDLQGITFNFAEYVRVNGKITSDDVKLQNLLLVYELLDLSARGLDLPEVLGYARGQLKERSFAAEQKVHLALANALRDQTEPAKKLKTTYAASVKAFRDEGMRLVEDAQNLNRTLRTLRNHPSADPTAKALIRQFSRSELVTKSSFETLFDDDNRHFGQATDLLEGKPPYTYWLAAPTIDSFQLLFVTDSLPAPDTLRAMGLSMLDAFLEREMDGEFIIFDRLATMARNLDAWKYKYDSLSRVLNRPQLSDAYVRSEAQKITADIEASKVFWQNSLSPDERRNQGFGYLKNLVSRYREYGTGRSGPAFWVPRIRYLERVDSTYRDFINVLERNHAPLVDPINVTAAPPPTQLDRTLPLKQQFEELERVFTVFRSTTDNDGFKAFQNTKTFEQLLNLGAQMLYILTAPEKDTLALPSVMATTLTKPQVRQFYQGLLYQQIGQQPMLGHTLSPRGLADLGTDISIALGQLYYPPEKDSTTTRLGRQLRFLTTVANEILETPLINFPGETVAIKDTIGFKDVPDINRRINEIYDLTSKGQFRESVLPLLDLVELFRIVPDSTLKMKRLQKRMDRLVEERTKPGLTTEEKKALRTRIAKLELRQQSASNVAIKRFRRLASFGAGLAAAESPEDVNAVLDAVAVPAGSSRNKRLYKFNVDLNAYFGGAYGRETLIGAPDSIGRRATTFGMFVPVGATVSWKPWRNREWSISAFLPIIDVGAITAYRSGENAGTVPEVSFQNVLAPGAHFMINIPKSPFFVGSGIQYGPNERKIGEANYSAFRWLFTFGIDVPILNLGRSQN